MAKKEAYIEYIYNIIREHKIQTANAAYEFHERDQNRPKPSVKLTQFKSYYKLANEKHEQFTNQIKKIKEVKDVENEIERIEQAAISRKEVGEMIANVVVIAYDNVMNSKSDKDIHAFNAAVTVCNKFEGYDKPTKLANTTASGDDVNQITISMPAGFILDFPSNTDESTT
jgi:chaperonin cofactor prefoldin